MKKTKKQEKARRSFEYQVKQASKCRHEKYMVSCFSCSESDTCEIQKLLKKAEGEMN